MGCDLRNLLRLDYDPLALANLITPNDLGPLYDSLTVRTIELLFNPCTTDLVQLMKGDVFRPRRCE
jgi:hypothetical protein